MYQLRLSAIKTLKFITFGMMIILLISIPAYTQTKEIAEMKVPDVLVLIMSGMGETDEISINYSSVVDDESVKSDIEKIKAVSNWDIKNPRITTEKANMPDAELSTSVNFRIKNSVEIESGKLPIGVFVNGLKRLDSIRVNFLMMQPFEFKGIRNYADNNIIMAFNSTATAFRYDVIIKDRSFEYIELDIDKINEQSPERNKRLSSIYYIVLLIAVIGAAIAYIATSYITKRNKETNNKEG